MSHVSAPAHVHTLYHDGQFFLPGYDTNHDPKKLASTPEENLIEYAGRLCYNSLHKAGRTTPDYHTHLLETGHYSVHAHHNFVYEVTGEAVCFDTLHH